MTAEQQAAKKLWGSHDSILTWIEGPERYKGAGQSEYPTYALWLAAVRGDPALDYIITKGNKDWPTIQKNLVEYYQTNERESWWRRLMTLLGRG